MESLWISLLFGFLTYITLTLKDIKNILNKK